MLGKRNNHLTDSTWRNEFDGTMTTTNLIFWIWPKLKPTNLMKPTNLNFTSGVLLTNLRAWCFFSCRRAKQRGQRGWELVSQGWGTCPSRLHQHIFLGKVNVGQCHEFWSNSKSKLHRCENFSVIFLPIFGYLDSVKLISLLGTVLNFLNTFFNQIKRTTKIEKLEAPNVVREIYK